MCNSPIAVESHHSVAGGIHFRTAFGIVIVRTRGWNTTDASRIHIAVVNVLRKSHGNTKTGFTQHGGRRGQEVFLLAHHPIQCQRCQENREHHDHSERGKANSP